MEGACGGSLLGSVVSGSCLFTWEVVESCIVLLEGARFREQSISEIQRSGVEGKATQNPTHSLLLPLGARGKFSPGGTLFRDVTTPFRGPVHDNSLTYAHLPHRTIYNQTCQILAMPPNP